MWKLRLTYAVLAAGGASLYGCCMRLILSAAVLALLTACSGSAPTNNVAVTAPDNTANDAQLVAPAPALPRGVAVAAGPWLPPTGVHQARAMALGVPPEMQVLNARLAAALNNNPQWLNAYRAQHPTGPLPWHPNLGLSEEEYRRYLALTLQLSLVEVDRVGFTVTRRPDGGLALAATGQAAPLNGIIVYPDRDRVETPLGPLTHRYTVDNREPRSPAGPWQGVQWSNIGDTRERPVKIAFGRRARGDLILYYDFGPSDAETVVLLFPAPAAAAAAAQ